MPKMFSPSKMFFLKKFSHENMKKPASKVAKPAQIQPKSQFLFHKNLPPRDFSIMTSSRMQMKGLKNTAFFFAILKLSLWALYCDKMFKMKGTIVMIGHAAGRSAKAQVYLLRGHTLTTWIRRGRQVHQVDSRYNFSHVTKHR